VCVKERVECQVGAIAKANACFGATMECFLNLESSAELGRAHRKRD
jgi:plasmid maintenance system antidote protein VapI